MSKGNLSDLPGVGDKTLEKMKESGYDNLMSIAASSGGELSAATGIGIETANKIIAGARQKLKMGFETAGEVLKKGGVLLSGFLNPVVNLFDWELAESTGKLHVKYKIPYADVTDLDKSEKQKRIKNGEPMEYSHTLYDQIGGQIDAGFIITGFYEDRQPPEDKDPVAPYMATCIAIRAVKP